MGHQTHPGRDTGLPGFDRQSNSMESTQVSSHCTDYLECPKWQKIIVNTDKNALSADFDVVGAAERMLASSTDALVTA